MARRNHNTFEKRMREQAKRERQEAKKQRKADRAAAAEDGDAEPVEDTEALMAELAELHRRYEDEEISLEELEERRAELTERMTIQ